MKLKKLKTIAATLALAAIAFFGFHALATADIVSPDNTITPQAGIASGAAQSNAAALTATTGRTQYITGFDISGSGATAASVIEVTVTGLATSAGGTLKYEVPILAGVTAPAFGSSTTNGPSLYSVRFPVPLPASATNTAITVTCPSFGSGNTNASVCVYGYLK